MTLQITAEHIRQGNRGKCNSCPIALAVNERLKYPFYSYVARDRVGVFRDKAGEHYIRDLPVKARVFANRFDRGMPVQPLQFDIEIPEQVVAVP